MIMLNEMVFPTEEEELKYIIYHTCLVSPLYDQDPVMNSTAWRLQAPSMSRAAA
jgi:hypothetical protein